MVATAAACGAARLAARENKADILAGVDLGRQSADISSILIDLTQRETMNALRVHFRNWVMKGTLPPPSVYPKIAEGTLVEPTKKAMGFPSIPGLPTAAPTGFMNPVIDPQNPRFRKLENTHE